MTKEEQQKIEQLEQLILAKSSELSALAEELNNLTWEHYVETKVDDCLNDATWHLRGCWVSSSSRC